MKKRIAILALVGLIVTYLCLSPTQPLKADGIGAASYDLTGVNGFNQIITVTTSAVVTIVLDDCDYTLVHLNIQNDGSTASVSTDYIVMMNQQKADGTSVTMAANYTDGNKTIVGAGAAATFNASPIPLGADGPREIQIKAVGHGCKAELIRGHKGP